MPSGSSQIAGLVATDLAYISEAIGQEPEYGATQMRSLLEAWVNRFPGGEP
jgi:hypothetical protein